MNSEFLKHLQSITPQGKAAEKRIFIPANVIKKEVEDADELRRLDSIDELDEATRSKYLKVYGKHKVGSDESKMNLARLKRDMAMLQRGGADAETMKKAAAASGRFNRNEKPDPSYNPNDAAMAGYRFARKATRSFDAGKKSPRKAAVNEEWGGGFQSYKDAHKEVQAGFRREASINRKKMVADIKAVHSGKMTPAAFTRKHKTKFSELPLAKKMAASRAKAKARYLAKKAAKASTPKTDSTPSIMEGFMRKKRLLRARTSGKTRTPAARKALDTAYDSELGRRVARKLRKGGATKSTVRSFINTDKPTTAAADRAFAKFNDAEYKKHKELQARGVNPKRLGFAESTKISEGSLGMRKGIRIAKSVYQKGNTGLGKRMDAGLLRSYSKTRAEVGLDPRITVPQPRYTPSAAEYAAMQGHAEKRRKGINKKYGIAEATKKVNPINKKYKGVKKTAKRVVKKLYQALSTPQDNIDFMITGRKF